MLFPLTVTLFFSYRVLEIMRKDAEKDPLTEPNAPRAKLLLDQVFSFSDPEKLQSLSVKCYLRYFM